MSPRERRLFIIVFVVLEAAVILPLWVGRYLPLLDLPNHLSAVAIWHFYGDPRFDFARYYQLVLDPLPYWAHYYFVHLLAYVMPFEIGNKLFLTLYAIGFPLGARALARRFGRSDWVSLFVIPLVWNYSLANGFIAFLGGLALLPWALVLVDRHCCRPSGGGALAVWALGTSLYFFHIVPYALFLLLAGLLVLTQERALSPRYFFARMVPVGGSAVIGLFMQRHTGDMRSRSVGRGLYLVFDSVKNNLVSFPKHLIDVLSSSTDEWVMAALGLAWAVWFVSGVYSLVAKRARGERLHDAWPELAFALTLGITLFFARTMMAPVYMYQINGRCAVVAALFGALALRGAPVGWRRALVVIVGAATLVFSFALTRMVRRFATRIAGFDRLVDEIPLHSRTLTLSFPPMDDPDVNVSVFNEWGSYVQLRRGGYNFYNWDQFPLRYRRHLPAPGWDQPATFNFAMHGRGWDYFLTHNEGALSQLTQAAAVGRVRLVDSQGPWKLWQQEGKH